jgi:hypothetical protein
MARNRTKPTGDDQKISASTPSYQRSAAEDLPACGDFDIRIARDGTWHYRGSPIGRKSMVKLFASVLRRDERGDYWLVTPVERGRILVEDAPFTAVECEAAGRGRDQVLRFRTNVDEWIAAGADHPIRVAEDPVTGEPSPYILVRDSLEALIVRAVFYRLVERAVAHRQDGTDRLGLWSKGTFFPLGRLP